ncbi:Flavinator of succinate dehydrogenase-domain-containing protein [Lipomyces oligophaga]|uniref:Flavinator of succinate dehydrogenase-domain-containing protein n=1 Tax=Lipomyces oligophaga TaxID=45792 RepID=UPI0034CE58C6
MSFRVFVTSGSREVSRALSFRGGVIATAKFMTNHRHLSSSMAALKDEKSDDGSVNIEFRIEPLPRPGESVEHKRARLLYQSRKRGILETDLLLSRFAKTYLSDFSLQELEEYDKFLDEYDWDIYYWVTDKKPVPERWQNAKVFTMLKEQVQSGEAAMRMPDL